MVGSKATHGTQRPMCDLTTGLRNGLICGAGLDPPQGTAHPEQLTDCLAEVC